MRIDPKNSILVDYDGVTDASSFLSIQIYFEASEPFQIEWFLKKVKIDLKENPDANQHIHASKYISRCIHTTIFGYECFLSIDPYAKIDVGMYSSIVRLKSRPDINIEFNSNVIMPSESILFYINI